MSIGILTSGGDCPGLNAVIRGAVFTGIQLHDLEFVGFRNGWKGVVEGDIMPLGRTAGRWASASRAARSSAPRAPTPSRTAAVPTASPRSWSENGIDALIAIGGEGTLAAAKRLTDAGIKIVGVPKTIDNDLVATDYTFGFDTAVQIATDAMDRLRTTGDSHDRCMVAEVMGRHVGWIALHSGMAAGAHAILIPEQKTRIDQICEWVRVGPRPRPRPARRRRRGLHARHDGRRALRARPRRLRPPAARRHRRAARARDRGSAPASRRARRRSATSSAAERRPPTTACSRPATAWPRSSRSARGHWGRMVALRGTEIVHVPFEDALGTLKVVPQSRYDEAAILFG